MGISFEEWVREKKSGGVTSVASPATTSGKKGVSFEAWVNEKYGVQPKNSFVPATSTATPTAPGLTTTRLKPTSTGTGAKYTYESVQDRIENYQTDFDSVVKTYGATQGEDGTWTFQTQAGLDAANMLQQEMTDALVDYNGSYSPAVLQEALDKAKEAETDAWDAVIGYKNATHWSQTDYDKAAELEAAAASAQKTREEIELLLDTVKYGSEYVEKYSVGSKLQGVDRALISIAKTVQAAPGVIAQTSKAAWEEGVAESKDPEVLAARQKKEAAQRAVDNYMAEYMGFLDMPTQAAELQRLKDALTAATKELEAAESKHAVALDMTTKPMQTMHTAYSLRDDATSDLSGAGKDVADAALSVGQNLVFLPLSAIPVVGQGLTLAGMSGMAAAQDMYEQGASGKSAGDVFEHSIAVAAIEALTEKIPLDNLADMVKGGGKNFVVNLFKQAGIEATEEGVSYTMNYILDKAEGDPNAKFDWSEFWQNVKLGGLSGMFFATGGTVIGGTGGGNTQVANTAMERIKGQGAAQAPALDDGFTLEGVSAPGMAVEVPTGNSLLQGAEELPGIELQAPTQTVEDPFALERNASKVDPGEFDLDGYGRNTVGAAEHQVTDFERLQNQADEFYPQGENAYNEIDMPTKDFEGRNIPKSTATVIEAETTPYEAIEVIEQAVADGQFSFDTVTDKDATTRARQTVEDKGWDGALEVFHQAAKKGVVSKDNVALGQALLNNAMNSRDAKATINILTDYASMSTTAAQSLQAQRMLKKLSPEGQLYGIQRSVANMQEELIERYGDKAPNLKIPDNLVQGFLDAQDQAARDTVATEIYKNIASQVPATWADKWNAWRYMSMLTNPRTHVRNIFGNLGFAPIRMIKDAIATTVEMGADFILPNGIKRTKAPLNLANSADRALVKAAFADVANVQEQLLGSGKYSDNAASKIDEYRTIFKAKPLEAVRKANSDAMEAEDALFSKPAYAGALAGYLKANGVSAGQYSVATSRPELAYKSLVAKPDAKVVQIGANAKGLSYSELKKRAWKAAESGKWFQSPHHNIDAGMDVFITEKTFTHAFSNLTAKFGEDTLLALEHLPEIVENAILTYVDPPKNPVAAETQVYTLFAAVEGKNGTEPIKLKVKEYSSDNTGGMPTAIRKYFEENKKQPTYNRLYDAKVLEIVGIEKEADASASVADMTPVAKGTSTSKISIKDLLQLVKGDAEKYILPESLDIDAARSYAIKEAQKATYRDANAVSDFVSQLHYHGKNPVGNAVDTLMEGVLPFRRTPANILVRGLEYSPAGLVKSLTYDVAQVHKGSMTAAQAIDDFSAGLVGTGLTALGAWLASMGLVSGGGSGSDEQDDQDDLTGGQSYALSVGGKNYTLDWLAPEALPFFVGVELYNHLLDKTEGSGRVMNDVLQALGSITEPMLEMSMLSGVQDLLDSVEYSDNKFMAVLSSAVVNYITQAFPTLFGQVERAFETQRETTFVDRGSALTNDMQYTVGKVANKLPVEFQQIPYIDAWGRTEETGGLGERIFNNFFNPSYTSVEQETDADREIQRLLDAGQSGVAPDRVSQSYKLDGEYMTADEYVEYATTKGQTSFDIISAMIESEYYQDLTDEQKANAIELAYTYAGHVAAEEVTNGKHDSEKYVELAQTAMKELGLTEAEYLLLYKEYGGTAVNGDKVREAYKAGMDPVDFLEYNAGAKGYNTDGKSGLTIRENAEAIQNSGLSKNGQELAWMLAYPEWAEKASEAGVSISDYIEYKVAVYGVEGTKNASGKTISGSKKKNMIAALEEAGFARSEAIALYNAINKG